MRNIIFEPPPPRTDDRSRTSQYGEHLTVGYVDPVEVDDDGANYGD